MGMAKPIKAVVVLVFGLLQSGCNPDRLEPNPGATASPVRASAVASMYALEFVGTASSGWAMNNAGDVVGRSYRDTGCGPFCLPPEDVVVWRGGSRIQLPLVPGYSSSYQWPSFINNSGLIGGYVGIPGSTTHAAVWTPSGGGYTAQDLGVFPGATSAEVFGLDDQGRMVGWSTAGGAIPTFAVPFMWTQAGGFVNLAAQGYPNEIPGGMSPGGKVVTRSGHWYQLGNPGSVVALPPPPQSFFGFGSGIINDNGDQAHFLGTGTQGLIYPFRLSNGVWQQISSIPTGHLSRASLGSINVAQDITFTAGSTGLIAAGPSGVGQPLAGLISPAYPGATVGDGGPMNNAGQILTQVMIGRSQRLMRMIPVTPCGSNCLVAGALLMTGQFVQDPAFPGSCFQGGTMYNLSTATVTVTSETGTPLANAQVSGRFLDDYWTNNPVSGVTNAAGVVTWSYKGLCGVGAIAFLIDNATLGTRSLDRTRGTLSNWVIPSVTPPTNQPPVAVAVVTCANLNCTFDGRGSTDDVSVTGYEWRRPNGALLSTQSLWSRQFPRGGATTVVLTVFDGGGMSSSQSVTFDPAGPPPPPNQAPVSAPVVTCVAGRSCTFDGSGSFDADGSVVGYRWYRNNGATVSMQAVFTRSFSAAGQGSISLAVTDNGGLTTSKSVSFTILP